MSLITKKDFEPMDKDNETLVADALRKSRVQMLIAFPFFGILAMMLKLESTYDLSTAGTDGEGFYFNPYFVKSLSEEEQNWLVVHEVMHAALKHIWRRGNRNHKKWNVACDYAIHSIMYQFVNDSGKSEHKSKLKMPQVKVYNKKTKQYENKNNGLYDPKYDNMSADEIYDLLPDRKSKKEKEQKPFHWFGINVEPDGTVSMLFNNTNVKTSSSNIKVKAFNTAIVKYDGSNIELYLNGSLACSQKLEPLEGEFFSIQNLNDSNKTAFEGYLKNMIVQKLSTGNKILNYTLNNTAADTSWNSENITLTNASFQSDGSVYSNGLHPKNKSSASIIKTPAIRSFDIEDFSVSIDFKVDTIPSSRMPIITGNISSGGDGGGSGDGDGEQETLDDHGMWDKAETQEKAQQKAQDWEGRLVEAAQVAESRRAGSVAGYMKRLIGNIVSPQKDWRILLNEFIQPEADDYSFLPPDRRFQDNDFFLPDLNDVIEVVKKIVFYIDTSGSIGDRELLAAYSEIVGACNQFSGKLSGWIGFFDHIAYGLHSFENVTEVLKIKPEGGGGTSFHAPFDYINQHCKDDDIAGIIILTDGYADWPKESITNGVPVLWLINNEEVKPPWGLHTTIKIKY